MEAVMVRWLQSSNVSVSVVASLILAAPLAAQTAPNAPASEAAAAQPALNLTSIEQMLGTDMARAAQIASDIWSTVLIGDKTKPMVTVGALAGGIVLLGLAYLAARIISRWVAGKLLYRFGLSKNGVAPLQSLTFYILL